MRLLLILLVSVVVSSCVPVSSPQSSNGSPAKTLLYKDHAYEKNIKSVRVYPASQRNGLKLINDVLPLSGGDYFILSFDEVNADFKEYHAKYIPCNADWTPSRFNDLQFISDYNEFRITDYEYSINSKVPYTNYKVDLPKTKLAGNYLIMVYRNGDTKDIVLTKRVVFQSRRVNVGIKPYAARGGAYRFTDHRVEFQVDYPNLDIVNPMRDIKVVIRQNGRWDNAIYGLKPTTIRDDATRLEYYHFGEENRFPSPREYRFFDVRTFRVKGRSVNKIYIGDNQINVDLYADKSRKDLSYENPLQEDLDGNYFIQNQEIGLTELESQYINVNFFVPFPVKLSYPVYVTGAYNLWDMDNKSIMNYNAERKGYEHRALLKQGYYNYAYVSPNASDPYPFDGARFEAENQYEVFVYFKEPIALGDQLIGYYKTVFNKR